MRLNKSSRYESSKDPCHPSRHTFQRFLNSDRCYPDRLELENYTLAFFDKTEEGEEIRRRFLEGPVKDPDAFSFSKMLGWFPDRLDKRKGAQVMVVMRKEKGKELDKWLRRLEREEIEEIVLKAMAELDTVASVEHVKRNAM